MNTNLKVADIIVKIWVLVQTSDVIFEQVTEWKDESFESMRNYYYYEKLWFYLYGSTLNSNL